VAQAALEQAADFTEGTVAIQFGGEEDARPEDGARWRR
jgi:hypothetical protein